MYTLYVRMIMYTTEGNDELDRYYYYVGRRVVWHGCIRNGEEILY